MQTEENGCFLLSRSLQNFVEAYMGQNSVVQRATGGTVHNVFKIQNGRNVAYLKVRGTSHAKFPQFSINPGDIRYERRAMNVLSAIAPEVFPHEIAFSEDEAALLMTDVNPNGLTLVKMFEDQRVTKDLCGRLGRVIGRIHRRIASLTQPIREGGDERQCINTYRKRLGSINYPAMDAIIATLLALPRQLIIGDLSPKNIGINDDHTITIFDLEYAHMGNVVYEVGYLLGHIYLHTLEKPEFARAFLEEYQPGLFLGKDGPLLQCVAAATMLYRLEGEVVSYPLTLSFEAKEHLIRQAYALLGHSRL